ncbi:MAG: hypothetical protein Q7V62_12155, partial [Actinomycetota bacterium]|nr:hypothetical protein [Actinomycetota bacterium]
KVSLTFNPKPTGTQVQRFFTYAPTRCTPAISRVAFTSYLGATAAFSSSITPTGCDQIQFDPGFEIAATNPIAGQSTGVSATVYMPDADQQLAIQPSHVSDVAVMLDEGTTIDLDVLNAVGLCSEVQLASDTCPAASKIGTASVAVPFLPSSMTGEIYLTSRDGVKFGYILRGARGTIAILRGSAQPVPVGDGWSVETTFQTLPQVPWSSATMNFTSAVVKNPANQCPNATAWAHITGYAGNEMIHGAFYSQTACPPETTLTTTVTGTTNRRTPKFEFNSSTAGATFECSVDSGDYAPCASPFNTPSLADGDHTFGVRAVNAGTPDPSPATASFTVDATPPQITISSPAQDAVITSSTVTLNFTTESGATNYCWLDNGALNTCGSTKTYTNVADGLHRIMVFSRDAAGNMASLERSFSVAVPRAPVVTLTSPIAGESIPTDRVTPRFTAVSPSGAAIASVN